MLSYGCPADSIYGWFGIGESMVMKSLKKFVKTIIEIFGEKYLRAPNEADDVLQVHMV